MLRARREPPRFRTVRVLGVERVTPRLVRVALGGPDLAGFSVDEPAASVRLLLPSPGHDALVVPTWNGNEFLLPDGSRPVIRTFTPSLEDGALVLHVVVHGAGVASQWAERAGPGDTVAVSGPGRGYAVDGTAPAYLVGGDESAIPAIVQLLEAIPPSIPVEVHVEVAAPEARLPLRASAKAAVHWHDLPPGAPPGDALVAAVQAAPVEPGTRVWVAGEAAAVQRIRRHLFEERGLPRTSASIRGYWKRGRGGDAEE